MSTEYSIQTCKELQQQFHRLNLHRPMKIEHYDAGKELTYTVKPLTDPNETQVRVVVDKFVGGGYAGQVYRVRLVEQPDGGSGIEGLQAGAIYKLKILIPPNAFAKLFRNILYRVGFQGPFQLQVNPSAARAGALWQKFIRRAASVRFGDANAVADIYATLVDTNLGSCGELSEWVEGRTWRLEVDDHMDLLKQWCRGKAVDISMLGSPEYRAKRRFMVDFVCLLHEMGAYEFARQYEWWTCKSQPNCLKRQAVITAPEAGLTAVDFRSGLVLLPFLPMSPGDFKLIASGISRGSLVQFDRGDIRKLEGFLSNHCRHFSDMRAMLDELKEAESIYRNSVPDVTHNHVRLLYSRRLWSTIVSGAITGWGVKKLVSKEYEQKLRNSRLRTLVFTLAGLLPIIGRVIRKSCARPDWRKHYGKMLTSRQYLSRAFAGKIIEKVISWHRSARVAPECAALLVQQPRRFLCHFPLSFLPACIHRFVTDGEYAKQRLRFLFVRPVKLYFNADLREKWLREMVANGQSRHLLSEEDANTILSQIKEPFIQKYLMSLVVHLLTLPVTQVVSLIVALIYVAIHWGEPNAWAIGLGILAAFQVVPISPGSLVRGFYVVYLVVREHNFKDYNIAVFLGFFKYVGYLAFPIQMTYRYPAFARFMAAHWATGAVHVVPVFGERGALLEHWVFCLFYNRPLTIRRRMRKRARYRATLASRYWHVPFLIAAGVAVFAAADLYYLREGAELPSLKEIWYVVALTPVFLGSAITVGCGGALLWKRIVAAAVAAVLMGVAYAALNVLLGLNAAAAAKQFAWSGFIFAILSPIGVILTEIKLPDAETHQKPDKQILEEA